MSLNFDKATWKRVTFGDVVANMNDYFDAGRDGVLPYVAGPHINPGEVVVAGYGSTDDDAFPPTFKRKFRSGDVLLHSRGIEKLASVDRAGVTGEKLFVLRSLDEGVVRQSFLVWLLLSPGVQSHMQENFTGSVNKFLNWKALAAMEVDLPPSDVQVRIADLLWAIEGHRLALERRSSALRSAFTAAALRGFDAAIGSEHRIVDLCDFVIGGVWGAPVGESEVDVIALGPKSYAGDVIFVDTEGAPTRSITKKQAAGRLLREGDIVLERSGGSFEQAVGRVIIAGPDLPDTIPTDFQRLLRPNKDRVEPAYLFWKLRLDWLTGVTRDYARRTTNISNLAVPEYLARTLVVPPRAHQLALVEEVGQWVDSVDQTNDEIESLGVLRGSVLAEALGGY